MGYNNCQFFKEKTLVRNVEFTNIEKTVLERYATKSFPKLQYSHKELYTAGVKVSGACGCKNEDKGCAYPFTLANTLQAVFDGEGNLITAYPVQGKMSMEAFNKLLDQKNAQKSFVLRYGQSKYGTVFYHMLSHLSEKGRVKDAKWVESFMGNYQTLKLFSKEGEQTEFCNTFETKHKTLWQTLSKNKNNKIFDAYKERIKLILLSFLLLEDSKDFCSLKPSDVSNLSFQIEMNKKAEEISAGLKKIKESLKSHPKLSDEEIKNLEGRAKAIKKKARKAQNDSERKNIEAECNEILGSIKSCLEELPKQNSKPKPNLWKETDD